MAIKDPNNAGFLDKLFNSQMPKASATQTNPAIEQEAKKAGLKHTGTPKHLAGPTQPKPASGAELDYDIDPGSITPHEKNLRNNTRLIEEEIRRQNAAGNDTGPLEKIRDSHYAELRQLDKGHRFKDVPKYNQETGKFEVPQRHETLEQAPEQAKAKSKHEDEAWKEKLSHLSPATQPGASDAFPLAGLSGPEREGFEEARLAREPHDKGSESGLESLLNKVGEAPGNAVEAGASALEKRFPAAKTAIEYAKQPANLAAGIAGFIPKAAAGATHAVTNPEDIESGLSGGLHSMAKGADFTNMLAEKGEPTPTMPELFGRFLNFAAMTGGTELAAKLKAKLAAKFGKDHPLTTAPIKHEPQALPAPNEGAPALLAKNPPHIQHALDNLSPEDEAQMGGKPKVVQNPDGSHTITPSKPGSIPTTHGEVDPNELVSNPNVHGRKGQPGPEPQELTPESVLEQIKSQQKSKSKKTGLYPAQEDYLRQEVAKVKESLPSGKTEYPKTAGGVLREDGPATVSERIGEDRGKRTQYGKGDESTGHTVKIPGDGEYTVHTQEQADALVKSLTRPIKVLKHADGTKSIIDGEKRVEAAKQEGKKLQATQIDEKDISPEAAQALGAMQNAKDGTASPEEIEALRQTAKKSSGTPQVAGQASDASSQPLQSGSAAQANPVETSPTPTQGPAAELASGKPHTVPTAIAGNGLTSEDAKTSGPTVENPSAPSETTPRGMDRVEAGKKALEDAFNKKPGDKTKQSGGSKLGLDPDVASALKEIAHGYIEAGMDWGSDLIHKLYEHVKSYFPNHSEDEVKQAIQDAVQPDLGLPTTKFADIDKQKEAMGMDAREKVEHPNDKQVRAFVDKNPDMIDNAINTAQKALDGEHSIDAYEKYALHQRGEAIDSQMRDIENQRKQAQDSGDTAKTDQLKERWNNLRDGAKTIHEALIQRAAKAGFDLRSQQMEGRQAYSQMGIEHTVERARQKQYAKAIEEARKSGNLARVKDLEAKTKVTPEEAAQISKDAELVRQAEQAAKDNAGKQSFDELDKAVKNAQKRARTTRDTFGRNKEARRAEYEAHKKAAIDLWKKQTPGAGGMRSGHASLPDPEILVHVGHMFKYWLEEGGHQVADFIKGLPDGMLEGFSKDEIHKSLLDTLKTHQRTINQGRAFGENIFASSKNAIDHEEIGESRRAADDLEKELRSELPNNGKAYTAAQKLKQHQIELIRNQKKLIGEMADMTRTGFDKKRADEIKNEMAKNSKGFNESVPPKKPGPPRADEDLVRQRLVNMARAASDANAQALVDKTLPKSEKIAKGARLWMEQVSRLGHVPTIGKLLTYTPVQAAFSVPEDLASAGYSKLTGLSSKSSHGSGFDLQATVKKVQASVSKGAFDDAKSKWKGTPSNLDLDYGFDYVPETGANHLAHILGGGRIHGAEKAFMRRGEFEKSYLQQYNHAQDLFEKGKGPDPNTDEARASMGQQANMDSLNAINADTGALYKQIKKIWPAETEKGKLARSAVLGFTRVSSNLVQRGYETSPAGLIHAVVSHVREARKGGEMTPETARRIQRLAGRGAVGTALWYLGYSNPESFGGVGYGTKENKYHLKPGEIMFMGHKIGGSAATMLLHTPWFIAMQTGASIRNAVDPGNKDPKKWTDIGDAYVDELPGAVSIQDANKAKQGDKSAYEAIGDFLAGSTVPGIASDYARQSTVNLPGSDYGKSEDQKAKPNPQSLGEGVKQAYMSHLPFLRQNLPTKEQVKAESKLKSKESRKKHSTPIL